MDARTNRRRPLGRVCLWLCAALGAGCDPAEPAPEPAAVEDRAGELCLTSKDCGDDEWCSTLDGQCGREGVCKPYPSECERRRAPVCSCDGVTYQNACFAAADGQSVDAPGECPRPTCDDNAACEPGEYCARPTDACAAEGVCTARPVSCSGVWKPVCGCNQKTYANACKAALEGISVVHTGAC